MKIKKRPLGYYVNKLKRRQPFAFARYGDGEWLTILGYTGRRNSNGCTFTEELCRDLRQVLKNAYPYDHGVLKVALTKKRFYDWHDRSKVHEFDARKRIDRWLRDNDIQIGWVNGDVLLEQALKGNLFPLIEQIREYRVLYVGNERLREINMRGAGFFPYVAYVQPPPQNAHEVKEGLLREVWSQIEQHKIEFIGWSSGLASKVFIDETYARFPEITQIDFGSSFDGYFAPLAHVKPTGSRSYIRKGNYDWAALRQVNTGEREKEEGEMFKNG